MISLLRAVGHTTVRNRPLLALAAGLTVLASGCATIGPGQAPDGKGLGALMPGTPRTQVIAEMGQPAWTGKNDDLTTDVFVFKRYGARAAKATQTLVHAAINSVTFGLWEFASPPPPAGDSDGEVQLEVRYDSEQRVSSVQVIRGQDAVGQTAR